jgi:hypothetical protein
MAGHPDHYVALFRQSVPSLKSEEKEGEGKIAQAVLFVVFCSFFEMRTPHQSSHFVNVTLPRCSNLDLIQTKKGIHCLQYLKFRGFLCMIKSAKSFFDVTNLFLTKQHGNLQLSHG